MDRKIVIKNLLSVLVFAIFVFLALGSVDENKEGEKDTNTDTKKVQPQASRVNLRSTYQDLSVSQVQSISNIFIREKTDKGFYGHSAITHDYDSKSINRDEVVIDHSTGLMWHQSGSDNMEWNCVEDWVRSFNRRGHAGYHDWRLPTVDEAASLLESRKNNEKLYIDPVFSNKQAWIWTGDKLLRVDIYGLDYWTAWQVEFRSYLFCDGGVYLWGSGDSYGYIRPVRSVNRKEDTSNTVFATNVSNVFHKRDCSKLNVSESLIKFDTPQQASEAGCLPCNYCRP